jgi:predicted dehydrogenase
MNVGVIGYGYWGPNLVRNFFESPRWSVAAVSDLREQRLAEVRRRYPSVKTPRDCAEIIKDPAIEALAIATPVSSHFEIAMRALEANKHVLVEKPLASTSEECLRLIEAAQSRNRVLMVDHTFVYTGAVRKIREIIEGGLLGNIYYYDSVRVNLGLFQHDVNVVWDLAVHDLSILDYVLDQKPVAVSATGISNINGQPENVAYITLFFPGREIAHIHVNWLAPVKVRRTLFGGSEKMIVYDDLEPSEKVKVYDKGITLEPGREEVYELLVSYRSGDMWAPRLDTTEALKTEVQHFADCIENGITPTTGGESGLRVVRLLEAAERSIARRGELVEFPSRQPTRTYPT